MNYRGSRVASRISSSPVFETVVGGSDDIGLPLKLNLCAILPTL